MIIDPRIPLPFPFDMTLPVFLAGVIALSSSGCLPAQPAEPLVRELAVVSLRPNTEVGATDSVVIQLSSPVRLVREEWPLSVHDRDGAQVAFEASLSDEGTDLRLLPLATWPLGQDLTVRISEGFYDEDGRPLNVPRESLTFKTVEARSYTRELSLRYPPASRPAPLNLQWIALASLGLDPPPREVYLASDAERIVARVERVGTDGVLLARLPPYRGSCDPLCPATRYALQLPPQEGDDEVPVWGEILTATIADLSPPVRTATVVVARGDRVTLEVDANEPVILESTWRAPGGDASTIPLPLVAADCVFVEPPPEELTPEQDYVLEVSGMDIAGNPLAPFSVPFRAPPRVEVSITELVPAPFHDWNDSQGGEVAFDGRPGTGAVTDSDEWIELVNRSTFPVDLGSAGISVRVHDTSPTEMSLDGAAAIYFGDGGERHSWWPGEALVFRPRGSIAQRGFVLEIWSGSRLLDSVAVGSIEGAVAPNGTPPGLEYESLARDRFGRFRWCKPTPGDPLPPEDCE